MLLGKFYFFVNGQIINKLFGHLVTLEAKQWSCEKSKMRSNLEKREKEIGSVSILPNWDQNSRTTIFLFSIERWAVVVAQLVERLLLTPEIHSLKPLIGTIYLYHCQLHWKDEIKKKEAWNGQIKKQPLRFLGLRILTYVVKGSITVHLTSSLHRSYSDALLPTWFLKRFTCLFGSELVKQEVRCSVILPL